MKEAPSRRVTSQGHAANEELDVQHLKGISPFATRNLPMSEYRLYIIRSVRENTTFDVSLDGQWRAAGVRLITFYDLPNAAFIGPFRLDRPVLPQGWTRHLGEAIGLLVVPSTCGDVPLNAVRVEYAHCTVAQPVRANLVAEERICWGADPNREDAVMTAETEYGAPRLKPAYLEPDAGWANSDGCRVEIVFPTQSPCELRDTIARILQVGQDAVIVRVPPIGGAFGGRLDLMLPCLLAIAAYSVRGSVTLAATPTEALLWSSTSHGFRASYKTTADPSGTLWSCIAEIWIDAGPYSTYAPLVAKRMAIHAAGPYRYRHVSVSVKALHSDAPIAGAMRGFGVAHVTLAIEQQIDAIARQCGIEPLAFRLLNALRPGDRMAHGQVVPSEFRLYETIEELTHRIDPSAMQPTSSSLATGVGFAAAMYGIGNTGAANPATVGIEWSPGSPPRLRTSTVEFGQGAWKALCRIACRRLGVADGVVEIASWSSADGCNSGATSASRTMHIVGHAVTEACDSLVAKLQAICEVRGSKFVGLSSDGCNMLGAHTCVPGDVVGLDSYVESMVTAEAHVGDAGRVDAPSRSTPYTAYATACHGAWVVVDRETGGIHTEKYWAVHDSGTIVDRYGALGQVYGGVAMGIGIALFEDGTSLASHGSPGYVVASASDVPHEIDVAFLEAEDGRRPLGLGEPAVVPVAATIASAVADAIGEGIRVLPISPETVMSIERRKPGPGLPTL